MNMAAKAGPEPDTAESAVGGNGTVRVPAMETAAYMEILSVRLFPDLAAAAADIPGLETAAEFSISRRRAASLSQVV
jgi:hypothetical protein